MNNSKIDPRMGDGRDGHAQEKQNPVSSEVKTRGVPRMFIYVSNFFFSNFRSNNQRSTF